MKKTLFLALAFGLTALSEATVTQVNDNTHITGTESVSTLSGSVQNVVNVGSSLGSGDVTVDTNWTLPNSLYIGGSGYRTGATTANNGTVTVNSGKTLTVGGEASTSAGSHLDIGNSAYADGTGTLKIQGGTVKAEQVIVGQTGGAAGHIIIQSNGELNLTTDKVGGYNGLHIYNGDVTVESGKLDNEGASTFIYGDDNAPATLTVNDKASLGTVVIGDEKGKAAGSLEISGQATVKGDLYVEKKGALNLNGSAASLDVQVDSADPYSVGGVWVNNASQVNVDNGAALTAEQLTLTGSLAKVTVDQGSVNTSVLWMQEDTNIDIKGTSSQIQAGAAYFTVTGSNYATGQIHQLDNMSDVVLGDVVVTMTGSLLDSLVAGHKEITLVSYEDNEHVTMQDQVLWIVDGRDITYTVDSSSETDSHGGLVLKLDKTDADHPNKDALVNDIINSMVSPTAAATINTLNGTIASLGGLFNVVKSQLQMPHNVEMPVGQLADESRLAYTGRYYVGANRVWGAALGAADRVATDGHGEGYHYAGGGYAVGYDRVITPQMYVGAAVGQMFGKYKSNNELMRDSQTTFEGSLYAHYTHEMKKSDNRFNVDAYIGGGQARNRAHGVLASGSEYAAAGHWSDTVIGCGLKLSYDIILSDAHMITPFVGIEGIHAEQDTYNLSNGYSSIRYHDGEASLWTVPVGVTYRYIAAIDKTQYIVPHVTLAYLGDISRKEPRVKYDWGTGGGEVRGARPACSGFEAEAGITWIINSQWSTGAMYTVDQRRGECYQQLKGFVSYSF